MPERSDRSLSTTGESRRCLHELKTSRQPWRDHEEKRIFRNVVQLAGRYGFEYCAFGMRMALPLSCPVETMCSNYPKSYQHRYQTNRYVEIDPAVRDALRSHAPIIWDSSAFKDTPLLVEVLNEFHITCGLTRGYNIHAGITALFTMASTSKEMCPERISGHLRKIESISDMAVRSMSKIFLPKMLPVMYSNLTNREKEVLRWSGDGRTAADIAQILEISVRTVNFHLDNAIDKLDALNKTNAVVKAAMLGLI